METAMLPGEPKGWRKLQEMAQRETDPKKLVAIIDKMNALLTEEEKKAQGKRRPAADTKRDSAQH
jgi:hypothetical protein